MWYRDHIGIWGTLWQFSGWPDSSLLKQPAKIWYTPTKLEVECHCILTRNQACIHWLKIELAFM